jgi:hypothetical protein
MKMKRLLKTFRTKSGREITRQQHHHHQKRPTSTQDFTAGRSRPAALDVEESETVTDVYTDSHRPSSDKAYGEVQNYSAVNENGRRTTTTTVRIPPPPPSSGAAVPPPEKQQQEASASSSNAVAVGDDAAKRHSAEQTRNLVKKFIADIWNRGEVDLIPEVCSPSLRFNGNTGKTERNYLCFVCLIDSNTFVSQLSVRLL